MSGAEVKFSRERENANGTDENTYANVTVMETQRTAASPHQTGSKVTPERVAVVVLSLLLAAALIDRGFNYYKHIQTNESLQNMIHELQALKRNLTGESCLKCAPGWEQHGGKCYYFSPTNSTWQRSKNLCLNIGADLVKIDSREEQEFLELKVREKMDHPGDRFWIGLTDSEKEDTWLWTDGTPLDNSLSFWRPGEPNDFRGGDRVDGEDCVTMGEKAGAQVLKCWLDRSCKRDQRYICEKAAETGRSHCIWGSS